MQVTGMKNIIEIDRITTNLSFPVNLYVHPTTFRRYTALLDNVCGKRVKILPIVSHRITDTTQARFLVMI